MHTFTHIVVPTDFSATARDALRMACALAAGSRARVTMIHVLRDVWREPCFQRELEQLSMARLKALADEEQASGVLVNPVLMSGVVHAEVGRYVADHDADLMVVGSHGYGVVHRFLLGSAADRLIRTARCPILVVPHESLRVKAPVVEETATAAIGAAMDHAAADEQC